MQFLSGPETIVPEVFRVAASISGVAVFREVPAKTSDRKIAASGFACRVEEGNRSYFSFVGMDMSSVLQVDVSLFVTATCRD